MYNVEGKIGGDSDLSPRGKDYARALPALVKNNIGNGPLEVSQVERSCQHVLIKTRSGRQHCNVLSRPVPSSPLRRRHGSRLMSLTRAFVMV